MNRIVKVAAVTGFLALAVGCCSTEELEARIDALDSRVSALEGRVDALEAKVDRLMAGMESSYTK